ncbi:MAG: hypothetical protein POELPBGB_03057 [Bacteroidia bacterium]|nr:hypothetical protein [Bacteroidia bacterium]
MKNINLLSVIVVAAIFSITNANAQSCAKEKTTCSKEQTLGSINAEILALERELANIEMVAQQNNVDLGKPYQYMILNKTAAVAVVDEKATAKN